MIRAFACEWTKLWRWRQFLAVWGVMAGIVTLFAMLFFGTAGETTTAPGPGRPASFLTLADLAMPSGLTVTLRVASQILGIVSFVLVAGSMAAEYSQGTLKVLLSRHPRRTRLLVGKTAALLLFASIGVLLAGLAQAAAATSVAAARGIDTGAWWSAANLVDAAALLLRVVVSTWAWGLLGLVLAIVLRSAPAAIGLGIGYIIVVESILGLVVEDLHRYLPGQALQAFVSGGLQPVGQAANAQPLGLAEAAIAGAIYAMLFAGVAAATFWRRDVTG